MSGSSQSENPQDRILRDTRIVTLRIWSVVGILIIGAMLLNVVGVLAPVVEFLAVGSLIAHGVDRQMILAQIQRRLIQ